MKDSTTKAIAPQTGASATAKPKRPEVRTMTRADLAFAVYRTGKVSRQEAADLTDRVIKSIADEICAKRTMKLSSFGTFLVQMKKERKGRNPRTMEAANIAARFVARFKPSPVLMARLNRKSR